MDLSEFLFTVPSVLSADECRGYIRIAETKGFQPALITTAQGSARREEIRSNSRVIIESPEIAAHIWANLSSAKFPVVEGRTALGLNPHLRFYRYESGEEFGLHQDGHFDGPSGERSYFTLMVYLNEGFEGGSTSFPTLNVEIVPRTGMALLFRHEIEHEGSAVVVGRKYAIRSDVMFSRRRA